jgi:hypothetical protein
MILSHGLLRFDAEGAMLRIQNSEARLWLQTGCEIPQIDMQRPSPKRNRKFILFWLLTQDCSVSLRGFRMIDVVADSYCPGCDSYQTIRDHGCAIQGPCLPHHDNDRHKQAQSKPRTNSCKRTQCKAIMVRELEAIS